MLRPLTCMIALLLAACTSQPVTPAEPPAPAPPLVLTGEITRADHQTYREIPFTPPPGTERISIDFAYTGKEQKTVIDIGLRDPDGQRGWSGGNKSHIEIGAFDATPSYKPGAIQQGEWKLVLGIPNIREGRTASYTATVTFSGSGADVRKQEAISPAVLALGEPGWRRGDFHMHTAHSDGSCDVGGQRQPCPLVNTADAARDASLDFVAITDHNTITQLADIRRLQANYPKTLLIPGTEVTTFFGHANIVGNTDFVDFQLGSDRLQTLSKLFGEAAAQGAFVSVNHPALPSGEACMGCGWTAKDTDWSRVTAIEVINGSTLRTSGGDAGGIAFWDKLLKQGYRITAIGGSDNHDATDRTGAKQSPVGKPTTVVYASDLSAQGIIAGVKSGRVFVDAAGLPNTTLDVFTFFNRQAIHMGDELRLSDNQKVALCFALWDAPPSAVLMFVQDGVSAGGLMASGPLPIGPDVQNPCATVGLAPGADHGYLRAELRDASGKLLLLGNPIYFVREAAP